eukprot:354691-Chlamydomonas_euryale.AAC.10
MPRRAQPSSADETSYGVRWFNGDKHISSMHEHLSLQPPLQPILALCPPPHPKLRATLPHTLRSGLGWAAISPLPSAAATSHRPCQRLQAACRCWVASMSHPKALPGNPTRALTCSAPGILAGSTSLGGCRH